MSLFRSNKLQNITSRFENLRDRLVSGSRKSGGQMKPRRLLIDPLEERQLLSLTPADWDDTTVNQTFNENFQTADAAHALAADNDGDFVVAWQRNDPVLDEFDSPIIDPATGDPMTDYNIYARYFTDDVQRLTLPDEVAINNSLGQYGTFSLVYGGSEVQKIDFSAGYAPSLPSAPFQNTISATVTFGFDDDGSSVIEGDEIATVNYNELDSMAESVSKIETALQGIGGSLTDVSITAVNSKEFLVNFGDGLSGVDQPELTVENVAFTSGFYPAVLTSTVREPITIGPIVVSPDDGRQTATSIESSFFQTSEDIVIGPINFPPQDISRLDNLLAPPEGPYAYPDVVRTPLPGVSVRPLTLSDGTLSLTQFDLIFDGATGPSEGASGKKDHPEVIVSAVADDLGASYLGSAQLDVTTVKEPSPEFRVNPEEPDDPFTPLPDRFAQTNPAVAMDVDGDFVITWQSEIPASQDHASVTDIFARQFAPVGTVDPGDVDFVPGVSAGDTFQVNTLTNRAQATPAVDMDDAGNFTIAWSTGGQDLSFFNGIQAQLYSRDGETVGDEFQVNLEDTSFHWLPTVGLSDDGHVIISWTESDDEEYVLNGSGLATVNAKIYNPDGIMLFDQFGVGGGGGSAIAFDSAANYVITWTALFDDDRVDTQFTSSGVHAVMRRLFDDQGNLSNEIIREEFRANSSEFDTGTQPLWPGPQYHGQPALDADGDLVIMFEGYGPAVSQDMTTLADDEFRQALIDLFHRPEYADLLPFFDPATESLPISFSGSDLTVGGQIDEIMIRAINAGATDVQVGEIRALLNKVAGLLRGEANGILFSSWDADTNGELNRLFSDSVANAHRDGENARYILTIDRTNTENSAVGITVGHPLGSDETGTFSPVYDTNVLNVGDTRTDLEAFLQGMGPTGDTWDAPDGEGGPGDPTGNWKGTVEVRVIQSGTGAPSSEVTDRQGTPWDLTGLVDDDDAVFEITFIGETHDLPFSMSLDGPTTTADPDGAPLPEIWGTNRGDRGVRQTRPSIAMEPDGDFVAVWTQNEEYSTGGISNQNIFFRRFDEAIDQAGPRMTDLVNSDGERVASGDFIDGPVQYIVIPFDEELMGGDPTENPDSVLNPGNFHIYLDDIEIPQGIAKVDFGMNKAADLAGTPDGLGGTYDLSPVPSNKWEAVLTLDANGPNGADALALPAGAYTVEPQTSLPSEGVSGLRDLAGNPLGFSGYEPDGENFTWDFVVREGGSGDPQIGSEMRINPEDTKFYEQHFSASAGVGTAQEESNRTLAVDHDGDFVVVWTSYGQDDIADATGAGVFMRMYNRDNEPLTGEISVNGSSAINGQDYIDGHQRNASVAMDADGEFVVVWESEGQDADGSWGIYGKRYNSVGTEQINPEWEMVQRLVFDTVGVTTGQFSLKIGDATTELIDFDSNDPAGTASAIQTAIDNLLDDSDEQLFPDVVVSVASDTDPFAFDIRFAGGHAGVVHPTIDYIPDSVAAAVSVSDVSDDRYIFQVNTEITGNQLNPAVGMDDFGNYVVVWGTAGQDFSFFNDVYGQRFSRKGEPQGLEFLVNTGDLPGTNPPPGGSFEINPAVAVSGPLGNFVVAWEVVTQQQNGVVLDSIVAARMFQPTGAALTDEFVAGTGAGGGGPDERVARNPQLDMDDQGGFIVVWESFSGTDYDVSYAQFTATGGSSSSAQVNMGQFTDHQVNPSVGTDADGDFTVVWNGNGAEPDPLDPDSEVLWTDNDNRGVFTRSYHAPGPGVTPEPVTVQSLVNRTTIGFQEFPSIGVEPDGDRIVVWSGRGIGDNQGIFARRYDEPTDTAGPRATELRLTDGQLVATGDLIDQPEYFVVVFDEDLWTDGSDNVENVNNWILSRDLVEMEGRIVQIQYGLNKSADLGLPGAVETNKWEAVLTLDGDPDEVDLQPLSAGSYTLVARHPVPDVPETPQVEGQSGIRDAAGNPLQRTGLNPLGADAEFSFTVSRPGPGGPDDPDDPIDPGPGPGPGPNPGPDSITNGRTHAENGNAVAMDGDGDHVVAITATDDATGLDKVFVRLFESNGEGAATNPGLFYVTTEPEFDNDEQRNAAVATDADGDFVVTWTNFRDGNEDIYARRFFANGLPMGPSFLVNTYTDDAQTWSDVAMNDGGDFVVTWSSYAQETNGQLGTGWGVYARRFDPFGQPLAPEFLVNVTTAGDQQTPSVAMSSDGGFIIVWTSDQNGVGDDIVAKLFKPDGSAMIEPLSGEIMINDTLAGNQKYPDVDITPNGNNFVVTWTSTGQDGSGDGIYGQLIDVELMLQGNVALTTPYPSNDPAQDFAFGNTAVSTLVVPNTFPDNFTIADVDFLVDIRHALTREVKVSLISPSGSEITVFEDVPRHANPSQDFFNTRFNDEAILGITDNNPVVSGPFIDILGYIPLEPLSTFDGQLSSGTWTIIVQDNVENDPEVGGTLEGWSIELTRVDDRSGEFLINQSTIGNQSFSSVAMNRQGAFTVAWSGQGDQENEEDQSGSGVFYRRFAFNTDPLDDETRANVGTDGNQRFATVDTDGEGNFAVVWTGVAADPAETAVYRFLSTDVLSVMDVDGPRVSDILVDDARLVQGDVLGTNVTSMTVNFSENLSVREGAEGLDSITNPDNWILQRNGSEIPGAITGISFGLNPDTRKHEAVLSFDGNGPDSGDVPLLPGEYVLTVRDEVNDYYAFTLPEDSGEYFQGNSLDGDFDGSPGTVPTGTGEPGFAFNFSVSDEARLGPEFRVNQSEELVQRISTPLGTGFAREENTRAVAMDHDGDFAVVWTSYGQDAAGSAGVYLRLYNRDDSPLVNEPNEILVNTTTAGDQRNAAVAVDADGELVVVWQSDSQDPDGSSGIYAQRFDSVGRPLGGEFRVNLNTNGAQFSPAVAMDNEGNFVIVWATASQAYSLSNDIRGQMFNYEGHRVGGEFLVNDTNLPGVAGQEVNPAVAMDDEGNFVVAWDQTTAQTNGVVTDSQILAKMFDSDGVALGAEFVADAGVGGGGGDVFRASRNPQVTMDDSGGFFVVWESFGSDDIGPDSYGVFYQEFDNTGASVANAQINSTEFAGNQVNPSVAVDADGFFAVVFNGTGATADPLDDDEPELFVDADDEGVFIRHYDSTNAAIDIQTRVNRTETGIQHFPTIVMAPDGDHLVVWAGAGAGDRHGIFARRYDNPVDAVGPIVSDLTAPSGKRIHEGSQVAEAMPFIVVTFDEDMATTGPESVTNSANYAMLKDGVAVAGMITSNISYGLNQAYNMGLTATPSNKWQAVIMLDGNGLSPGTPTLPEGEYELQVKNTVRDVAGNPLGSTRALPDGIPFSRRFNVMGVGGGEERVNTGDGDEYTESPQTVASDADGDTVTVWVNRTPGNQGIYARANYVTWTADVNGDPVSTFQEGPQILVADDPTAMYPSVAVDGDGDFVVTWSQENALTDWDVYARRYDALGNPLGDEFMANSETEDDQQYSTVAMDENGDFAITWQGFDPDGDGWDVYAQRYNPAGIALGGRHEVQVVNFVGDPTGTFRLQWFGDSTKPDATNNINFNGDAFAVLNVIRDELAALGAEVEVKAISSTEISITFVGTDGRREQPPILMHSQAVNGDPGAHVAVNTVVDGSAGEFIVNDDTDGNQQFPAVAMDAQGNFVVSWTAYGQDGDGVEEGNINAKLFPRNGVATSPVDNTSDGPNPILDGIVEPLYMGSREPDAYLVPDGTGFDGVATVFAGGGMGSGSLLSTGIHVLTAAHVVDSQVFSQPLDPSLVEVVFSTVNGLETIPASSVIIHPDWNGDLFNGADVAIITLEFAPSAAVERYEIYRQSDEVGQTTSKYGFGNTGHGDTGQDPSIFDGLRRGGTNRYDATGGILLDAFGLEVSDGILMYDFDNGLAANDAFGIAYGINDLGYGNFEVGSGQGDSGGPTFIDGKIAGVTSFGMLNIIAPGTDVTGGLDFSFGELRGDARVSAYAEWIDAVTAFGPEFSINQTTAGNQQFSAVAMDADGDFVITWTSSDQDGFGGSLEGINGVFARRFSGAAPVGDEFQVNTFADGDQQHSAVAMDADGDFVIAWESQDQDGDGLGIYAQRFARNEQINQDPLLGPAGQIGGEFSVNITTAGDQASPGVAIDDTGNFVVVWNGNGEIPGHVDPQGVFRRRFERPTDTAGSTVTDIYNVTSNGGQLALGQLVVAPTLTEEVSQFVIMLGESMSLDATSGNTQLIENPYNWTLTKDGELITGGVASVEFGLNKSADLTSVVSGKYEAIITFDGDPGTPGLQPLGRGSYVLSMNDAVEDLFENSLDGNLDGTPGDNFSFVFGVFTSVAGPGGPSVPGDPSAGVVDPRVNSLTALDQSSPAMAANADGDYVVVWINENVGNWFDPPGTPGTTDTDVVAQRFNRFGQKQGFEFLVSSFASGIQAQADVAMDRFGNFVVTWAGQGEDDPSGVYARVFDATGTPQSEQFRVNQSTDLTQESPKVAVDANGEFAISWTSTRQDLVNTDIYVRRYNTQGLPVSAEILVNSTIGNHHETSDIAMNADGDFVVVWAAIAQDESSLGIFGQRFDEAGTRLGGEFRVNAYGHDKQFDPQVAMDLTGDFVVTWSSFLQDNSSWGVYGHRFSSAGASMGGEFRVSQTTLYAQHESAVSMDDDGNFVITWNSFNQEPDTVDSSGIFARMFNANGTDYIDPGTGGPLGEFRINATTEGEQTDPVVAMDSDGDFAVAWVGPDTSGTGIYHRVVSVNTDTYGEEDTEAGLGGYTGRFVYAAAGESTFNGSGGNDLFEVIAGGAPGTWIVRLNGEVQDVAAGANSIAFNGMGGYDTVNLIGLAAGGNDSAELWPDHGTFTSAGVTFTQTDVDSININGGTGEDSAIIHDSASDDTLFARAAAAAQPVSLITMADTANSYSHRLDDFEILNAYSTSGIDTASLFDSDGPDKFISHPDANRLRDDDLSDSVVDFNFRVKDFQYNHAYAKNGGVDLAEFHDTDGLADQFKGYPTYSKMFKGLYQRRAKFFENVVAYATPGDGDYARLFDSDQNDSLIASPTESRLFSSSAGYDIRALAFDSVLARAKYGFDTAEFIGGSGDDLLQAKYIDGVTNQRSPKTMMMDRGTNGGVYEITARKFDQISAHGGSGVRDIAKFWDTLGDDRFVAEGDRAAMYGPGNELIYDVLAFEQANINRVYGGSDTIEKNPPVNFDLIEN